ncbi:MAG: SCO family protein [Betaproteobacteria bacterium]
MDRRHSRLVVAASLLITSIAAHGEDAAPDTTKALELSQSVIGARITDYAFTDSRGRPVRLSDYRGKPLLVNFVYTGCSQVCPTTVRFLGKAIREARGALGPDGFAIATIGFNQPFDTPQAMHAFATQHGIAVPEWDFLSPAPDTIEALTREFGFTWYATPKGFDHVTQVTVLDAEGRIYRQIYGDSFDIPMLIEPLKQLITGTPAPAGDWRALLEKVRLFCTVYDRSSGRYRLDYSLFVEIFVGLTVLGAVIFTLLGEWRRQRAAASDK